MAKDETRTVELSSSVAVEDDEGLAVVLIDREGHAYHALPDRGSLTIGRSETSALCIDRPWISRAHAVLHLGPPLSIEDRGAHNGVRVGTHMLEKGERCPLAPGEAVQLGTTMMVVQRRMHGSASVTAISHGELLARLRTDADRAARLELVLEVVAVAADPSAEWEVRAALAATHSLTHLAIQPGAPFLAATLRGRASSEPPLARKLDDLLRARGILARVDGATLPDEASEPAALVALATKRALARDAPAPRDGVLAEHVATLERQRIVDALEACGYNQTHAAKSLGIARNTLIARMNKFGLGKDRR